MNHLGKSLVGVLYLVFGLHGYAADLERGAREYKLCAGCHGFAGEGNKLVGAPGIAGQEAWYVSRQLKYFQQRIRGSADDEAVAQSMAMMSQALDDAGETEDLLAYISSLPALELTPADISGDVAKGQALYAPCAACHGSDARGDESFQAPALTVLSPWYQITQLKKFKNGRRGYDIRDTFGRQMAPMVAVLPDDQAMYDVVAYINSLPD
jgi:cytochrome c oxidase subunit 2